jgi:hypothetical protein
MKTQVKKEVRKTPEKPSKVIRIGKDETKKRAPVPDVTEATQTMNWEQNHLELVARFSEVERLKEAMTEPTPGVLVDLATDRGAASEAVTITMKRTDLTEAMKIAVEVASAGRSLPILSHVRMLAPPFLPA